MLHGYNRELTLLLDDVRELAAELQGVDSAEAAVASDLGPAWKRLAGLSDDYSVLRAAQRKLMDPDVVTRARPTVGGEEHASDLFLANLDTIWPEWRSGEGLHGVVVTNVNGAPARYEPWPSQQPQLLLWLATSAAEPWVPTHGQLQQLWAQRAKKANPMPRQSGGPVQQPNLYGRVTARVETARI